LAPEYWAPFGHIQLHNAHVSTPSGFLKPFFLIEFACSIGCIIGTGISSTPSTIEEARRLKEKTTVFETLKEA
jgi:hypothetical protein